MATVNIGRLKFVWQGTYNAATAYVADDVVYLDGTAYVCILASTGNAPPNATYWNKMAQGSDLGSLAGLSQGDMAYYNGTDWVRLATGTGGTYLETQGASANPQWSNPNNILQVKEWRKLSTIVNNSSSDSALSSPFDGTAQITPTTAGNIILAEWFSTVDHGVTWRSSYARMQWSTNNSTYYGLSGGAQSHGDAASGSDRHGNMISISGMFNPNTTNTCYVRVVVNGHTSGAGKKWGQYNNEGNDTNTTTPNTDNGEVAVGHLIRLTEFASGCATVTNVAQERKMDINTFTKCFDLFKAANSDHATLGVMISDINHDNAITESSWESQCEWRLPDSSGVGSPVDKPDGVTWSAISAFQTQAEAQDDYSN